MSALEWLENYDTWGNPNSTMYEEPAEHIRSLLTQIKQVEDRDALVRYVRAITYYANQQMDVFVQHDDNAQQKYHEAREALSQELRDAIGGDDE